MRFSAVFDPRITVRPSQDEERTAQGLPGTSPDLPVAPPSELPDDLDQRVRQVGEWQLEDW